MTLFLNFFFSPAAAAAAAAAAGISRRDGRINRSYELRSWAEKQKSSGLRGGDPPESIRPLDVCNTGFVRSLRHFGQL